MKKKCCVQNLKNGVDRIESTEQEQCKKVFFVNPVPGFDRNIDKSIGNWSTLPKAPNQDVILLKKARGNIFYSNSGLNVDRQDLNGRHPNKGQIGIRDMFLSAIQIMHL